MRILRVPVIDCGYVGSVRPQVAPMRCKSCGSENVGNFNSEVAIHFPGLENIHEPAVFVFPNLVVCRDCGFLEFVLPAGELRALTKGKAAGAE